MAQSRRNFLVAAPAVLSLAGCQNLGPQLAGKLAELMAGPMEIGCKQDRLDPNWEACGVSIDESNKKLKLIAAFQKDFQWCWAACIEMAFRFYGYEVSQNKIVTAVYGREVNLPGFSWQIHRQLSRDWKDSLGKKFSVRTKVLINRDTGIYPSSSSSITTAVQDQLEDGHPLIIGTGGHAMLLVAQEGMRPTNQTRFVFSRRATVIDPWPFSISALTEAHTRTLSSGEIQGANFLATVEID